MSNQWGSNMDSGTRRTLAVIAEIVAGAFLGLLAAAVVGIVIGRTISPVTEGFGDIIIAVGGAALASLLAASGGVTYVGRNVFKQPGSFWMALLGAIAGAVIVMILLPLGLASYPSLVRIAFIALPSIFSALVFTWSARRRERTS
jgi:hypothetical protein